MKVRTLGTICQNPQHGFQKLKAHGKQNSKNYSGFFPYTHSPTLIFINLSRGYRACYQKAFLHVLNQL